MIAGLDHIALPLGKVEEMLAFYRAIGAEIREEVPGLVHSAYLGRSKINFHMPDLWQSTRFDLRGPEALPGSGDLCLVWTAAVDALLEILAEAEIAVIEGPVQRTGGLQVEGTSVYVRDPDDNLVEFLTYP